MKLKNQRKATLLRTLLITVGIVMSASSHASPGTAIQGDLMLGFELSSASGAKNLLVDLGQFPSLGSFTNLNLASDLTTEFGSSYANTVSWGIFATGATNSVALKRTIYATSTNGTGYPIQSSSTQQGQVASYISLIGQYNTDLVNGQKTSNGVWESTSETYAWSSFLPDSGAFGNQDYHIETSIGTNVQSLYVQVPSSTQGLFGSNTGFSFNLSSSGIFSRVSTNSGGGAYAGPLFWTGGSGSWSTTNNWFSNTVATNGAVVGISGASGGTITNNAVSSLGSLTYSNTAGTYTLTGSNIAITGGITNNSTNTQTIALGLTTATNQTINAASGNLVIGGAISNTATLTLAEGAAKSLALKGQISGTGALVQSGLGTVTLSSSNSYTGGTTVSAGTLVASNAYALGATNGALNVTGGTLNLGGLSAKVGATTLTSGSIGNGTLTASSLALSSGTISASLAGAGALTKSGTGTVTLSGNDTAFTGAENINAGTLIVGTNTALGGTATIATNATLRLSSGASLTSTNAVHLASGTLSDNSGLAFTNAIKGSVALSGSGTLQKTYAAGSSVAGFGATIGSGVSFSLLAGYVTNASTLNAQLVTASNGPTSALNFKGTYGNSVVLAFSGITNSTIQWYDTNAAKPFWTNTVFGDTNIATKYIGYKGFSGSFSTFLLSNSISQSGTTWVNGILGAYGYDSTSKTAWAVIDHNSIFDAGDGTLPDLENVSGSELSDAPVDGFTLQAVPEPSTYALFGLGALLLVIAYRRKANS